MAWKMSKLSLSSVNEPERASGRERQELWRSESLWASVIQKNKKKGKRQTKMRRKIFARTTQTYDDVGPALLLVYPVYLPRFPLFFPLNRSAIKSSANKQINFVMGGTKER